MEDGSDQLDPNFPSGPVSPRVAFELARRSAVTALYQLRQLNNAFVDKNPSIREIGYDFFNEAFYDIRDDSVVEKMTNYYYKIMKRKGMIQESGGSKDQFTMS